MPSLRSGLSPPRLVPKILWRLLSKPRAKVLGFRDYVGRINKADVEYLQRDPNINEAIADLHALSHEVRELAWKLSDTNGESCGK